MTWYLNRRFTFRARTDCDRHRENGRYFVVQTIGAGINLGMYVAAIAVFPTVGGWPVIPLATGSAVAMVFNFLAARSFAYRGHGLVP